MSNPSDMRNHDNPSTPRRKSAGQDDLSEVTVSNGKNPEENHQTMTSKVLKFSFVYDDSTKHRVAPSIIHTHWMQIVQESLGDDIIIINNHNKNVETVSTIKWSDPQVHQKQFKLHQKTVGRDDKRNTTYYILHRIQTNETVGKIKALPTVKSLMKEYNFFITDHQWSETEWETTRIGFVTNMDPSFYNRTQAHQKFNEMIAVRSALQSQRKLKIPQFRLAFSSPKVNHASHTVSTKAYAIEVMQDNAVPMLEVLNTLFNGTPTFVAYNLRRKFPEGYEKAIRYQTHLLQNTMVVVLQNISSDMMFYLQAHIMAVQGVREILASPKGSDIGRYSLLVDKDQFEPIRSKIKNSLTEWINQYVESDALPTEYQFPGPARVKPLYDDGLSSGENSWMTQSNASFMSIELPPTQDEDFFRASMNANRIFTFDEFTVPAAGTTPHQRIIPPTSVNKPPAWATVASTSELTETEIRQQQEIERLTLERDMATKVSQQIIDDQRNEIEALKNQRILDNNNRKKEAEDAKSVQTAETHQLREDLRNEMKMMMEQFMMSLKTSMTVGDGRHSKRPPSERVDDTIDDSPSEKRRDDRTTPVKLFPTDTNPSDSPEISDAMDAEVLPEEADTDV
jgi:hypothetical protein